MIIYRIRRQDTHDDRPRETYNVFASQQKAIKEFNALVRRFRKYLSNSLGDREHSSHPADGQHDSPPMPLWAEIPFGDSAIYIALDRIVLKDLSKKNLAMALLERRNFSDGEQQLRSWNSRRPNKICRTIFRSGGGE